MFSSISRLKLLAIVSVCLSIVPVLAQSIGSYCCVARLSTMVTPTEVSAEQNNPPVVEKPAQNDTATGAKMSKKKKKNAKKKAGAETSVITSEKSFPQALPTIVRGGQQVNY